MWRICLKLWCCNWTRSSSSTKTGRTRLLADRLSLIAGLAAKEVVVSSMGILFGIVNIESASGLGAMLQTLGNMGFGALNAYSMMILCYSIHHVLQHLQ